MHWRSDDGFQTRTCCPQCAGSWHKFEKPENYAVSQYSGRSVKKLKNIVFLLLQPGPLIERGGCIRKKSVYQDCHTKLTA